MALVILSIGVAIGVHAARERGLYGYEREGGRWGMMNYAPQGFGMPMGSGMEPGKSFGYDEERGNEKSGKVILSRVFGAISKIDGNQITVTNNAAMSEVIVSHADTVITNGNGEISLSALKPGDGILAIGSRQTNNDFAASFIRVQ